MNLISDRTCWNDEVSWSCLSSFILGTSSLLFDLLWHNGTKRGKEKTLFLHVLFQLNTSVLTASWCSVELPNNQLVDIHLKFQCSVSLVAIAITAYYCQNSKNSLFLKNKIKIWSISIIHRQNSTHYAWQTWNWINMTFKSAYTRVSGIMSDVFFGLLHLHTSGL